MLIPKHIYNYKNGLADLSVTDEHRFLIRIKDYYNKKLKSPEFKTIKELSKMKSKQFNIIPKIKPINSAQKTRNFNLFDTVKKHNGKIIIFPPKNKIYAWRNIIPKKFIYLKRRLKVNNTWTYTHRKAKASDLTSKDIIKLNNKGWLVYGQISPKTKLTPIILNINLFYKFLGWFISEGCIYKSFPKHYKKAKRGVYYKISISQINDINYIKEICSIIEGLGFYLNNRNRNFSFCSEIMYLFLKENCGKNSFTKKIPDFVYQSNTFLMNLLFETMYKGDGNKRDLRYNTNSYQLVQDLIRLCILLGNNSLRYYKENNTYRVKWHNRNKSIYSKNIKTNDYQGKVYCCTTRNNNCLYAGRNGNFTLTGQSLYGTAGNRFFRLYDKRVASATTFLVRDLLHYVKDKIQEVGYEVVYIDTDAVFINTKENLTTNLNSLIQDWAKKYNKNKVNIKFAYEGIFEQIIMIAMCRYKGWLRKSNGELKIDEKGIESKRKDSTVYIKKSQTEILERIRTGQSKETIIKWVKDEIKNFPNQTLADIAIPCRLGKAYIFKGFK